MTGENNRILAGAAARRSLTSAWLSGLAIQQVATPKGSLIGSNAGDKERVVFPLI